MSYGHTPGGEQEGPAGPRPGFGAPPPYPGQPAYASPGAPPPTYQAWVTTATICGVLFNLILGLPAALVGRRYSKKVTELWARGDGQAAISASRKTRAWLIASIALDVIGIALSVVLVLQAPSSQPSNSSGQYHEPGLTATSVIFAP
jgi:predicted cobalt transporter CbtA